MGRGTRLCPDLFGPRADKEYFLVLDYCENLEFFGANPEMKEAGAAKSLSERLFAARLDLVRALDQKSAKADGFAEAAVPYEAAVGRETPPSEADISADARKTLQEVVAGMNLDNFIVRQRRRTVEKYREPEAWTSIDDEKRKELVDEIAPLPSAKGFGTEEAKRFDLLMFSLELALLKGSKRFDTLRKQLLEIASALEEQTGIPAIAYQAVLIEEIQTDLWWEGITVPLLELVRLRLRDLVQHIEKAKKAIVYSNFTDEIGDGVELALPQIGEADFVRFKQKARHFLKAHEDHIVLHKLRQGRPLTPTDLAELENMLLDAGIGEKGDIERARETSQGFGRFVRSLVGLDRAAVNEAFGDFLSGGTATATQIAFIDMVIEHLAHNGVMDPALLYEPPFTGVAPTGPEQVFDQEKVTRLVARIDAFNLSAVA
jgi:type I restriction enzyme, R subunit